MRRRGKTQERDLFIWNEKKKDLCRESVSESFLNKKIKINNTKFQCSMTLSVNNYFPLIQKVKKTQFFIIKF